MGYTASDGNIWSAVPYQQGSVTQLSTDALLALMNQPRYTNLNPIITQAFNKGIIAMGDLASARAPSFIYDPAGGTLDQVSDKPFGVPWNPNTRYRVGHVVSPSTFITNGLPAAQGTWSAKVTGHLYRCTVAGTSDASQPAWPTTTGATVASGTATFQEYTPTCASGLPDPGAPINPSASADSGSPIINGATVYVALTYVSARGESINQLTTMQGNVDPSKVLIYTNTTGSPVDLSFVLPAIPPELQTTGPLGGNGATGYNVYTFIVQGTTDPAQIIDPTFYAQFGGTNMAPGTTVTLNSFPVGQTMPTINSAVIASPGNVDTGLRWMVVFFVTRTNYQTGFSKSAPIPVYVTQAGLMVLAQKIPIGPYNTICRICAFTVAGASSAGPYTYVDEDDVESPGFNQADIPITSTRINDNTTTSAQFNFTDSYLPGASDVTNYFQRIEMMGASDAFFSKTLGSVIYTGVPGFPSGHLVSDYADPEAVRVPGSNIQVSESDGDRTVCWREFRENQISCKENSGHAIVPNSGDPSTWKTQRLWAGSGPVGPKAIAIGIEDQSEFIVYGHRNGGFRYVGGTPQLITRELMGTPERPGLWDRINWDYGYLMVTSIDEKRREVRFSVPFDGSTVRNLTITVNYFFGWEDPVIFAARSGRLVPNVNGRKWSLDDLAVADMVYIPRRYNVSNTSLAGVDLTEELLLASTDGALYSLKEGQYWDDNYAGGQQGYFSQWLSVPGPNPTLTMNQLMGASCSAVGNGFLNVYAVDDTNATFPLSTPDRQWMLSGIESQRDFGAVASTSSRFGVGFDNGAVAGAWYEMHNATLWVEPTFATRPG
jgi:hypothetical protein